VTVCVYFEYDPLMVELMERTGAAIRLLELSRGSGRLEIRMFSRLTRALASVVRQIHPFFLHVQYMAPGVAPILVGRLLGVPRVLATIHVPASHYGPRASWPRFLANRVCDAFICVSQAVEASFFGNSAVFAPAALRRGRKHFTIWNSVDIEEVDHIRALTDEIALRQSLGVNGCKLITMLSRLSPEKGPQYLLDAMPQVMQRAPSAKLLMIGDGPQKTLLQQQARQLGIERHVIWAGKMPRQRAFAHLAISDVVVIPSQWEGFGLAAIEAMAFGKPVVASDIDGLREVVAHGQSGILVPVGDTAQLGAAICGLLQDETARHGLGRTAREHAVERYSFRAFAGNYLGLYSALSTT
jgi:glycosyltransferase involved in cell wall biosynthesis